MSAKSSSKRLSTARWDSIREHEATVPTYRIWAWINPARVDTFRSKEELKHSHVAFGAKPSGYVPQSSGPVMNPGMGRLFTASMVF